MQTANLSEERRQAQGNIFTIIGIGGARREEAAEKMYKNSLTDIENYLLSASMMNVAMRYTAQLRNCATAQLRNCATAQLRNC